jgi:hypothetical protein
MLLLIFGLSVGYVSVDKDYTVHLGMNELNEKIGTIHEFEKEQWGWGGSLFLVENNLVFKAKILKGNEVADLDSVSLGLYFDSKLFELGYAFEFSRFIFSLSGGGGQSTINLRSVRESDAIDFSGSLSNPTGSVDYKGSSFVLSASADVLFAISDYLGVGVSTGYVYGLSTPEIVIEKMEGIEIQNAPAMSLNKTYIKFVFALGDFVNL